MERRSWEMPSDVLAVHREIEAWRMNREKRGPVPSSIWLAASRLAKRYGVYRIASVLRLNYRGLKRRLSEASKPKELSKTSKVLRAPSKFTECEFVELSGIVSAMGNRVKEERGEKGSAYQLEIEVSNGLGSQMRVLANEGVDINVSQIVREFWSHGR